MKRGLIIRVVSYKLNPRNPAAFDAVNEAARKILGKIPGTSVSVGAPGIELVDGKKPEELFLFISWDSESARDKCLHHPKFMKWCEFMLNGWMMISTRLRTPAQRRDQFINYILVAPKTRRGDYCRDTAVPDSSVMWASEEFNELHIVGARR
mgnify:CR=1 FL=1